MWLYLYLVVDIWSRKVVAWEVAEREDPAIDTDWTVGVPIASPFKFQV